MEQPQQRLTRQTKENLSSTSSSTRILDASARARRTQKFLESLEQRDDKYVVTMKYHDVEGVLKYADQEETRKLLDETNNRKCASNSARLEEAVILRDECAKLLGYTDHKYFQLEDRIAKHPEIVLKFLKELQDRLTPFAEKELKTHFADPMIGLVVVDRGKVCGAVILNNCTPGRNIDVTAVGHCWSVKVIRFILRHCFSQARRVTAQTSVNNHAAIKALQQMGFQREGLMREFFDDGDAIVFGLLKSEQRVYR